MMSGPKAALGRHAAHFTPSLGMAKHLVSSFKTDIFLS
jgi:hypothetical protein